jgi:hypothetical protein
MSSSHTLALIGRITSDPVNSSGDLSSILDVSFSKVYPICRVATETVTTTRVLLPASMTYAGLFVLRVLTGGPVTVTVTSPGGATQTFTVEETLVLHSPTPANGLTAVSVAGSATFNYAIAGT